MPPKQVAASTEGGATDLVLTPTESKYLAAIVSLMPDVPEVNYQVVADLVGVKYGKNARQTARKLFEKLRNSQPAATTTASSNGAGDEAGSGDAESGEGDEKPAKAVKAKVVKKGTAKKVVCSAAPKKATAVIAKKAAPVKKGTAGKGKPSKAVIKHDEEDEDMEEADGEDAIESIEQDDGKSLSVHVPHIHISPPHSTAPLMNLDINGHAYQYTVQDVIDAGRREIDLKTWLLWKSENFVESSALNLDA